MIRVLYSAILLVFLVGCEQSLSSETKTVNYEGRGWVRSIWVYYHNSESHSAISFEEEKGGGELKSFYLQNIDPRLFEGMHVQVKLSTLVNRDNPDAYYFLNLRDWWCTSARERLWKIDSISVIR